MTTIVEGFIFKTTKSDLKFQGYFRVLQLIRDKAQDQAYVVFIQIPTAPRKRKGARQANYYARGFLVESLSDLENWKSDGLIVESLPPPSPALWGWSDAQIVDSCPPKKRILINPPLLNVVVAIG